MEQIAFLVPFRVHHVQEAPHFVRLVQLTTPTMQAQGHALAQLAAILFQG